MYVYLCYHMTNTGPVGIGDELVRKSVCVYEGNCSRYRTSRLWNPEYVYLCYDMTNNDKLMRKSVCL